MTCFKGSLALVPNKVWKREGLWFCLFDKESFWQTVKLRSLCVRPKCVKLSNSFYPILPSKKKEENAAGRFPFGRDYFFETISTLNRMFRLQQMRGGVCGLSGIDVSKQTVQPRHMYTKYKIQNSVFCICMLCNSALTENLGLLIVLVVFLYF